MPAATPAAKIPAPEVRAAVAEMLTASQAFNALPPSDRLAIAQNTNAVLGYLAQPEGIDGNLIPGGVGMPTAASLAADHSAKEASWQEHNKSVDAIGKQKFTADAAREGAKVAGLLLNEVQFPTFVSGLIHGVFQSITDSSIQQMRAYQEMIASVAKSLHEFTEDNVTPNQGRDHMVDQFPDLFEIGMDEDSETPSPKLQLKDGVDENEALKKVNNKLEFENGQLKSLDLSDQNVEKALVENSRLQLARQRQQLLASIVLMGINRIVVTDGRISAKIIYDVKAKDSSSRRRSASAMDVARDRYGRVQSTRTGDSTSENKGKYDDSHDKDSSQYSADYYSKGEYKFEDKPVITAQTSASEASSASLQTKIQLSGSVDVNFKSDYLPLDKMATPQMIASIQGNATPADPNLVPSARTAPAAAPAPAPAAGAIAPVPAH